MILSLQALVALNTVFDFKLKLRVVRTKLKRYLIYQFRCQCIVTPALQVFMLFVLEHVLPLFEEFLHFCSNLIWMTFISNIIANSTLQVICDQRQRLWCWRSGDLTHEFIPVFVLQSRLFQKHVIWSDVKDSIITLIYHILTEILVNAETFKQLSLLTDKIGIQKASVC